MLRREDQTGEVDLERDSALVDRSQRGDPRAFEDLYLRYHDRLRRYCVRRLNNAADADDAVQETFARAWKALPSFAGERRFYPWLSVIAANLCVDVNKKGSRCSPVEEEDLDLLAPSVSGEQELLIERDGERDILSRALTNLSQRHREVLELREGRNWSYQQIASHEGVAVSTIETLLFRARRSLRQEFMQLARAEGALGVALAPLCFLRRATVRALSSARAWATVAKGAVAGFSVSSGAAIGGTVAALATAALVTGSIVAAASPASRPSAAQLPAAALTRAGMHLAPVAATGRASTGPSAGAGSGSAGRAGGASGRAGTGSRRAGGAGQSLGHRSGSATGTGAGAAGNGAGGAAGAGVASAAATHEQSATTVADDLLHRLHQIIGGNPAPRVTKIVKKILPKVPPPTVPTTLPKIPKPTVPTVPTVPTTSPKTPETLPTVLPTVPTTLPPVP